MTHSTAGGIIRSRLRRRSEGCFDWTTYLDVLIQLYYPLQLRKRTKKNYWTMIITSSGVFCGPRDFVVGTPYSTDQSFPNGPTSQSITWNRTFKPSKWKQHLGRVLGEPSFQPVFTSSLAYCREALLSHPFSNP